MKKFQNLAIFPLILHALKSAESSGLILTVRHNFIVLRICITLLITYDCFSFCILFLDTCTRPTLFFPLCNSFFVLSNKKYFHRKRTFAHHTSINDLPVLFLIGTAHANVPDGLAIIGLCPAPRLGFF